MNQEEIMAFTLPALPTRTMRSSRTSTRKRWKSITPSIIRRTSQPERRDREAPELQGKSLDD